MNPQNKYKPFPIVRLDDRTWPGKTVTKAPLWCSVDLRDGNQALEVPMTVSQKIEMFEVLVRCGFKEIEVGFPAASPTEFAFIRCLIEENRIPDDVTIQVLVQARKDLIAETVRSLRGAKKVIIHLYNSTSPAQRSIVFGMEKPEIVALAVQGTEWVKEYASSLSSQGTDVLFQYSPESFSATEPEFALEVCEAVMGAWQPAPERKMIVNLPCTVEVAMPNVYADQIEWFCRNMTRRDSAIISVHTHNDRGTGVAATELGLLAGADRVEGTLFGNGERTGNLDIVIVALNLFTQGIDPGLDFSALGSVREAYERCTGMKVPERHPYSGDLVFTAFSGSHQDAVRKGFQARAASAQDGSADNKAWDVPYLTIDPADIGRAYDAVVRVNGQSGKGGIAHLLERGCGINLPKDMIREFGSIAGKEIDALGREVGPADLKAMLWREYVNLEGPYRINSFNSIDGETSMCRTKIRHGESILDLEGSGNGPLDAFMNSFNESVEAGLEILDQAEHALGTGSEASAISYVQLRFPGGEIRWGAGVDVSIPLASVRAVISALNRK